MKLNFFKTIREIFCKRCQREVPCVETSLEQIHCLLIRDGKVVGKPFSSRRPEIRIIYVDNFVGAFLYFLRLCDQRFLNYQQTTGDYFYCTAVFPDGKGRLSFTDKVNFRNKKVVAVLKIEMETLKSRICEIRFETK